MASLRIVLIIFINSNRAHHITNVSQDGGVLYSGSQLGVISGTVETNANLPYVGVGFKYDFGNKNGKGAYLQAEVGPVFGLQAYADIQNDKFEDQYVLYGLTIGYRF